MTAIATSSSINVNALPDRVCLGVMEGRARTPGG
jgi:hypothetical protein